MLIDNIISQADVKKQQEYRVFLCKMNREIIREITNQSYSKVYSPQLSGADEFSFVVNKQYDGQPVLNYDDIVGCNLVKIQQGDVEIGYFEIQDPEIKNDGITEIKSIKTYSAECKLINKKIYLTEGTFKIVNEVTPTSGILNIVTSLAKSWSIGYVDPVLINKERYFDIADTNVYELLLGQVQQTFECVFDFDTINKQINVYSLDNFGRQSPIIISMQNIMDSAQIDEISKEIVTRLHLYGDNELTIRDIMFGNDYIDNFSYFKNTKFMSQSLIDALNVYDALVASYQTTYTNYLNTLYSLEAQLVTANSDLLILQGELISLEEQKSFLQSTGQSTTSIQTQINNKQSEINTKINTINSLNSSINSVTNSINSLINILSLSNNLTQVQIEELDEFIKEDTYQDSSFLVTDSSTYNEKIDVEKDLLSLGTSVLARVSNPRYKLNIDVIDFLKNKEFSPWWNELYIGDIISINVDDSFVTDVRVTGYSHDWDENKLTIQLGDKYKYDDPMIELLDLLKPTISAGTTVDYNKYKYGDYVNNNKNEVLSFINSSIDLNKNAVIGGTNQEMLFDQSGLLMRRWDTSTNNYSPKQLKITNNAIVLTDDAFTTAKTAIGQLSNGLYGVAAEVIAGKMILGNNMIIETGNGDFRVDGSGVNITKMALNLTSGDNLKNILIDPTVGIKIRSRQSTSQSFVDRFFFDNTTGKFKFNGDLEAAGGTFSGALSAASGTFSGTVSAGTIIGGLINGTSITGANVTSGTITGTNIIGVNMSSSTIEGSTISGATIFSNQMYANNDIYIITSGVGQGLQFIGATNAYIRQSPLANTLEIGQNLYVSGFANIPTISSNLINSTIMYMNGVLVATINDISGLQAQINSLWSYVLSL